MRRTLVRPAAPAVPAGQPGAGEPPHRGAAIQPSFSGALEAIWANRLRSLLTTLGVIVGVAAVIAVVTLTEGTSVLIAQRIATLGTNTLIVLPGATNAGGALGGSGTALSLTQADADALQALPHVTGASPVLGVSAQVVAGAANWNTRVQGVYPSFEQIENWTLAEGAWFSQSDENGGIPVAVLGQTVAANLFPQGGASAIGQTVLIKGQAFQVMGVLAAKGTSGFSNQDDVIYVPFNAANARLNNSTYVAQIQVRAASADDVSAVQQAITTTLETRHRIPPGGPDDFSVRSSTQFVQTAQQLATTLALLLVGIAAISLIVGGIGIMNIMLVSVTERTREIGVRMAVGARRADIRNQFLIEALTLSSSGGVIGIVLGLLLGLALTLAFGLPFVPSPLWIAVAFIVAALVGIIFGLYPAIRASQLDPIVALRAE